MSIKYAIIGEQLCWPHYYTWIEGDNVPATFESEATGAKH